MSYQNKQTTGLTRARKNYTPQFKFDRALEVIKNNNLSETSRKYDINANVISKWKSQLIEYGAHVFENSPDQEKKHIKK